MDYENIAPIMRYTNGWHEDEVVGYARGKGWEVTRHGRT